MTSITQGIPHPVGPLVNQPSSIRTTWPLAAIIAAIFGHGVFGRTFPSSIGWQEALIGGLLMTGLAGAWLHQPRQPSLVDRHWWITAGVVVLVIIMGSAIGLASGHPLRQYVRDLVPAGFLLLPIIASPLLQQQSQRVFGMLILSLEVAGGLLALRVLTSIGFSVHREAWKMLMGGSDGGISVDPLILFAAGSAMYQLLQRQAPERPTRRFMLLALHAICLASSVGLILVFAQRLPFLLVISMLLAMPLALAMRRQLSVGGTIFVFSICCLIAIPAMLPTRQGPGGTPTDGIPIVEQMYIKQRDQGSHAKIQEAQVVWATVNSSPVILLGGTGLGSSFSNPVLENRAVGYTHALPTYLLLKFGLIGCVMLTFATVLFLRNARLELALLPVLLAIGSAVSVGVLTQATHKTLPYYLLVALGGGLLVNAAWRHRPDVAS